MKRSLIGIDFEWFRQMVIIDRKSVRESHPRKLAKKKTYSSLRLFLGLMMLTYCFWVLFTVAGVQALSATPPTRDPYHVLGVKKDASLKEIKKRYHELALIYHPDKNLHMSKNDRNKMAEKFKDCNIAYETLKSTSARRAYDMQHQGNCCYGEEDIDAWWESFCRSFRSGFEHGRQEEADGRRSSADHDSPPKYDNVRHANRQSLYDLAASGNISEICRLVDEWHVNVNESDPNNSDRTALHAACDIGHFKLVQILITRFGANVNVGTWSNETPLFCACERDDASIAEFLLEKGADPNISKERLWYNRGWSILHAAVKSRNVYMVRLLLKYGADSNVAKTNGWTPLHEASKQGHIQLVKLLLESGASMTARARREGRLPIHAAVPGRFWQSPWARLRMVRYWLKLGVDVNTRDGQGDTLLHYATGRPFLVLYLLWKGADRSLMNNKGRRPFDREEIE